MLKQIIAIFILSIVIILAMPYAQSALGFILSAHDWVSNTLKEVFSGGQAGNLVRELLALLTVPVIVGLIPVLFYWLAKRTWFPYVMQIIWIVWLIQTAGLVLLFKVAS
jgi:hypothetical protein